MDAPTTAVPALRRCAAPLLSGAALGGAAMAASVAGPTSGGLPTVPCLFHTVTGLWCPLCGLTRGVRHALHGDVVAALSMHPLTPVVMLGAVACWVAWFAGAVGDRPAGGYPVIGWTMRVIRHPATWVLLTVFTVVRNLPGMAALRP